MTLQSVVLLTGAPPMTLQSVVLLTGALLLRRKTGCILAEYTPFFKKVSTYYSLFLRPQMSRKSQ